MIDRIVRLQFHPEHIDSFLIIYKKHQINMRKFPKCHQLDLLEDVNGDGLFFTYSIWESEDALDEYRSSKYFREIWSTIKPWFSERAQAWSLKKC